jgi:hypothetical protein
MKKRTIKPTSLLSKRQMLIFALAFVVVGAVLLLSTHAAGPTASLEAESSSITSPAAIVSDLNASKGSALKFQAGGSSGSCPLPAYPDETCTGVPAGTTLTTVNGDVTLSTAGEVYQNKLVKGQIIVRAPNVTIKNTKIMLGTNGADAGIDSESTGLLIQDVEVDCGMQIGHTGITWGNYTALRANVHGCDNAIWAEQNATIQDSYEHDEIPYDPVRDPHTDGVQVPSGAANITIKHNRLYGNYIDQNSFGNSAITNGSGESNILIQDNLLAGGGYTLYCGPGTNFRVINNHFSTIFVSSIGGYGPWFGCDQVTASGNVIHETGQPLIP